MPSRSSSLGLKKPISLGENLVLVAEVAVPGGPCSPCGPCGPCGPWSLPSFMRLSTAVRIIRSIASSVCWLSAISSGFRLISYSKVVLESRVTGLTGLRARSEGVGVKRDCATSGRVRNSPGCRLMGRRDGGCVVRIGSAATTKRLMAALRVGSLVNQSGG